MTATTLSLIILLAAAGACAGDPWLSNGSTVTDTLGLAAMYWAMASFSPSSMLIPSWASAPVRAPMKPSFTLVAPPPAAEVAVDDAVVVGVEVLLLEPHAVSASAPTPTRARARTFTERPLIICIPFLPRSGTWGDTVGLTVS